LRLVSHLRRDRAHERAVWGLLVYQRDELRAMLAKGCGLIVVKDARLLSVGKEHPKAQPISINVARLLRGIDAQARAYRARHPDVWIGAAWVPATRLAEQVHG